MPKQTCTNTINGEAALLSVIPVVYSWLKEAMTRSKLGPRVCHSKKHKTNSSRQSCSFVLAYFNQSVKIWRHLYKTTEYPYECNVYFHVSY